MAKVVGLIVLLVAAASAAPADRADPDPVIFKQSSGLRYQYIEDGEGKAHLVDQWFKVSDANIAARYNPDLENVYHLFTRSNPSTSQPFLQGRNDLLSGSNFSPLKRTIFIVHGWTQSATSEINAHLAPAFLAALDCQVVVVDWSAGSSVLAGTAGPTNAVLSGYSLAKTINWIMQSTGLPVSNIHLVGFSLGVHQVGVAGRNVNGQITYITGLDPGANMEDSGHLFGTDAALYTETINTNSDIMGHGSPLGHVNFYPNGGDYQPGCGVNFLCNHYRSFYFFAATFTNTFKGARCQTYAQARLGLCSSITGTLEMGGIYPKIGSSGIYHLTTSAEPPFTQL